MGLVNLAIDFATVLNASQAVALKHMALRSRQLDAYGNIRSSAAIWRHVKSQTPQTLQDKGKVTTEDLAATEQTARDEPHARTPGASEAAPGRPNTDAHVESHLSSGTALSSSALQSPDHVAGGYGEPERNLGAPPNVNIDVFRTARGSWLLKSLGGRHVPDAARPQPASHAKEHPMRHWPQRTSIDADNSTQRPDDAARRSGDALESLTSPPGVDEKTIEAVKELSGAEAPSASAYKLRQSKVPASRLSRMWNYGSLAAGMLGGAMTESVSRAFGGSGGQGSLLLSDRNMERMVARLSRMRGAALKLGQIMSLQDSKMLPASMQQVLQRVQDKADYMPAWQRDRVLVSNLGHNWRDVFSEFEERPIAAASIGQVHKAVVKSSGKRVAVKIQFPGVAASIDSDLDNLGILLGATKFLPKGLYLNKTIDNARTELGWECDYEREAQCARRYRELLRDEDVFVVPDVHLESSGKQVLTMDLMDGIAVTQVQSLTQEQRDWIGTHIFRLCLREITEFMFMQTDPNWTNFFYNAKTHKLELLDFGASREYPEHFVRQYIHLLEAASRADREGVRVLSEGLGYLTGHESKTMVDAHVDSVITIAEPFHQSAPGVYDFREQTITDRVRASIPVMLRERLTPPPEETYSLHRKLSGAFLLCARLESKVPCRELFAQALDRSGYMDQKV